jgi:peptide/nickel transport system permease protein
VLRLLIRRAFFAVFVLWGVSVITFLLSHVVPGDPARMIAGPHANAATLANVRAQYGLDKPLPEQYVRYAGKLLGGDFGQSFVTFRPVGTDLVSYLPASLELAIFALVVGSILGIVIGSVSAIQRGKPLDTAGRLVGGLGLAVPSFWLAMLFQILFYSHLHWLPFGGRLDIDATPPPTHTHFLLVDSLIAGQLGTFVDSLRHLVLPGMTLAVGVTGLMVRISRTSMLEVLSEDYMRTAKSKGISRLRIFGRHSLRNAMLPVVTVLGLEFGYLAGGIFLVENIFAWPGIGRYAFQAILNSDYNALMAVTLVIAAIYIAANFLVDVLYTFLDPRVRLA